MAALSSATNAIEQGGGALPQFDASQWPGEMIYMTIIFAILVLLFTKVFVPRVGGAIAAREDRIAGDIGQARRLRDEAEAQSRTAAEELAQARSRSQRLALDARAAAAAEAARSRAAETARLGEIMAEAEARIAAARARAMAQVRSVAAEAAEAMVGRLTGAAPDAAEIERALAGVE
ncbi:MAG TPA: hypothetical protein VMU93_17040 [Caulobacteraceae bacterium]|nr:hypothetical protein [Caulobacteraceae bacterium]